MPKEDMKARLERVSRELRGGDEYNRLIDVAGSRPWADVQRSGVMAAVILVGVLCVGVTLLAWPVGVMMAFGLVDHVYGEERRITSEVSAYQYREAAKQGPQGQA